MKEPLKPIRNVGTFYKNLALSSYNHDWEAVAYHMGGATTHTAVAGSTYLATSGIASSVPKNVSITYPNFSKYALAGCGNTSCGMAVATANVSTTGAVAVGKAALYGSMGTNIYYSKRSNNGYDEEDGYNTPRNNKAQNRQVDAICRQLKLTDKKRRYLHEYITGQGYSYQEILKIAKDLFGNGE